MKVLFYPAKEREGIIFVRKDLEKGPAIRLCELSDLHTDRRSKIGFGEAQHYVETVEHILAALWGADIDNIRIELTSSELPAMDGSAIEFLKALEDAGIKEQEARREYVEVKEPVWTEDNESFLGIFPGSDFKISYLLEYPNPGIGRQFFSKILDPDLFQKEIAPASLCKF